MGVTISSKNLSVDMGYSGFMRFRNKVANLSRPEFGEHYSKLEENAMSLFGDEQNLFFDEHDKKTNELIKANIVTVEIANFCYQADYEGSIDQEQARQIYEKIKWHEDDTIYGYVGRADRATFSFLKDVFRDCVDNGGTIDWW